MELFTLFGRIAVDGVDEANRAVSDVTGNAESSSSKVGDALGKIGGVALKVAKTAVIAIGAVATGIGALTTQAVSAYADYEQLVGGVETLFKESSDRVLEYANNAYQTAGMSANEYMETVTSFSASLLQSLGNDTEQATEYANMAITDMSDNANKMGSDMASIQNAYQGFAKQNYTMLDNLKLGYGGTKEEMERLLADAEKLSGVEYDISSYADIVDAIHVVQTEMGITGTTAFEASTTISGSINTMKGAWTNFMTGMADDNQDFDTLLDNLIDSVLTVVDNLAPRLATTVPRLVTGLSTLVQGLIPYVPELMATLLPALISGATTLLGELANNLPSILETFLPNIGGDLGNAIVDVMSSLGDIFQEILPQLMELAEQLLPIIVQLIQEMLPSILQIVQMLLPVFLDLIGAMIPIVQPLLDLLKPILDLIILLLEPLIELINVILPPLTEILTAIVETIVSWLEPAIQLLSDAFSALIPIIMLVVQEIGERWTSMAETVQAITSLIKQFITSHFSSIRDNVMKIVNFIKTNVIDRFVSLKNSALEVFEKLKSGISTVFEGIWGFIKTTVNNIIGGVEKMCNGVISAINGLLGGISTVANKVGSVLGLEPISLSLNPVSLPRLEKGGVLEAGQVGLLEGNGSEAVVPLENNKKWISRVSEDMQTSGIGGNDNETKEILKDILALLISIKDGNDELPDNILDAIANGLRLNINNREFARLVKAVN